MSDFTPRRNPASDRKFHPLPIRLTDKEIATEIYSKISQLIPQVTNDLFVEYLLEISSDLIRTMRERENDLLEVPNPSNMK